LPSNAGVVDRSNGNLAGPTLSKQGWKEFMSPRARILLLGVLSATVPFALSAADKPAAPAAAAAAKEPAAKAPASKESAAKDPRVEIAAKIPGAKPEELRMSPIPGVYELARGTDIAYVSNDGKYALVGDLYDMDSNVNLTEKTRRNERVKLMSSVPDSQTVVFSPKDPKYTISVFTDVDCGYCRKLHSQIADYNKLGIKVRYLLYPRSGPDTESWVKAEQVVCSKNPADSLTRAKRDEALTAPKHCPSSHVAEQYELGQEVGISGTPAIVLANGELLPGYLPPQSLAKHLQAK
jgi:thiol:disulfide interchange protein DsbC